LGGDKYHRQKEGAGEEGGSRILQLAEFYAVSFFPSPFFFAYPT